MPTATSALRRGARALDRSLNLAARRLPASVHHGPLGPWLRRAGARMRGATRALDESGRLSASKQARILIEQAEAAAAAGDITRAVDLMVEATELGVLTGPIAGAIRRDTRLRQAVAAPDARRRLERAVRRHWDVPSVRLAYGAFLLDIGAPEGREHIVAGYRQLAPRRWPELAAAFAGSDEPLRPSFMIVGPPKAATTTLYALLTQHPRVIKAPRKELHFWNGLDRSPALYAQYFPPVSARAGLITGEASPSYLNAPAAAAAVAVHYPDMRVIVLSRDPVARAYSHHQMRVRNHREQRTFEAAIEDELATLGEHAPLERGDLTALPAPYLLGSCILPDVREWSRQLGAEQVLVVETSSLADSPEWTVAGITTFLGLEPAPLEDVESRNVSSYPPIEAATAQRLHDWFAPHEAALAEFLASHPAKLTSQTAKLTSQTAKLTSQTAKLTRQTAKPTSQAAKPASDPATSGSDAR